MSSCQPGILAPVPAQARYLFFTQVPAEDSVSALKALAKLADGESVVVGVGLSLARYLSTEIVGLRPFPSRFERGMEIPSTPYALWCWLRGTDRGELLHLSRRIEAALAPALRLEHAVDAFRHGSGRDLTGYEDGTENPKGKKAQKAALSAAAGLAGSSFVAIQQWLHDFARFEAMPQKTRDNIIGRRMADNVELEDAPASAHVKRTAQESFDPEAFVLRRSMPWIDGTQAGLMFTAFGHSLDAFEAQMRRMAGAEDGVVDGLFRFTRPLTGSYFWCPPMVSGRLDLRALGV